MASKIAIIGCGWLGFPLARKLVEKGFDIKGSTTSLEKLIELQKARIKPYQISISEDKITGDIVGLLTGCEILIINIPPRLRKNPNSSFVKKMRLLVSAIQQSSIQKVLFVSSTSVYRKENELVKETTIPNPDTESGKQLIASEKLLKKETGFKTSIIRFSGLIGNDRHPIKFLVGKSDLKNGKQPVNLVHLDDCIRSINFIIQQDLWNEEFNIAYPDHPSRKSYYSEIAKNRNLPLPAFAEDNPGGSHKIISSEKIQALGFRFKNPI